MAGKGSKLRKGANLKKYWDNYDSIFRKYDKESEENPNKEKNENISKED